MSCNGPFLLLLHLLSLVLLLQAVSGDNELRNGTSCPAGQFVQPNRDNVLTFFTDNTASYDQVWFKPANSRLPALVKACKDAHFKLHTSNSAVAYEIILGAYWNYKADIRLSGAILAQTIIGGLLQCDDFRPFLIAWTDGRIVVSRGTNGSDVFIEWSNRSVDFIDVELVRLAGYQHEIQFEDRYYEEYQFQESEVLSFGVKTPAPRAYRRFQQTLWGLDGQRFWLRTAEMATIAFLASTDKDFNKPTYTLTIRNTETYLYDRNYKLLLGNYTPGILSSEESRSFWIAWKEGRFAFGSGFVFYENSLLTSPVSMLVEMFNSMAVDSARYAQWDFAVQDYTCVARCQLGWYPDESTGDCRQCSSQLPHCFSCTQTHSSKRPTCISCANGTLMLNESGECLTECPSHSGYTPDHVKRECVCSYGSCCGPTAFHFCSIVLPCLFGALLLVPILIYAVRRLRRVYLIDSQRINLDQLSKILQLLPGHVVETLFVESLRIRQESFSPNDLNVSMANLLTNDAEEIP